MLPVAAGVAGVAAGVAAYRYLRRKKPTATPSDAASVETAAPSPPPAVAKAPSKTQQPPAHSGAKTGLIAAGVGSALIGVLALIPVKGMPLWKAAATKAGAYAVMTPVRTSAAVVTHTAASKSAPVILGEASSGAGPVAGAAVSKPTATGRWLVVKLAGGSKKVGAFTLGVVSASVMAGFNREFGFEEIGSIGAKMIKRRYEVWRTGRGEHCIKSPRNDCVKCRPSADACTPIMASVAN